MINYLNRKIFIYNLVQVNILYLKQNFMANFHQALVMIKFELDVLYWITHMLKACYSNRTPAFSYELNPNLLWAISRCWLISEIAPYLNCLFGQFRNWRSKLSETLRGLGAIKALGFDAKPSATNNHFETQCSDKRSLVDHNKGN